VVKLVVVGGERNPASLASSLRMRGRELEGKRGATVAQADEIRTSREAAQAPWTSTSCRELVGRATQHLEHSPSGYMQGAGREERSQGCVG